MNWSLVLVILKNFIWNEVKKKENERKGNNNSQKGERKLNWTQVPMLGASKNDTDVTLTRRQRNFVIVLAKTRQRLSGRSISIIKI